MIQVDDFLNNINASLHSPPKVVRDYFADVKEIVEKDQRGYTIVRPPFSHSSLPEVFGLERVPIEEADLNEPFFYFVGMHHNDVYTAKHLDRLNPLILDAIRKKKCTLVLDNVMEGNQTTDFYTRLYMSALNLNLPVSQIHYITNNIIADINYAKYKDTHLSLIEDAGDTLRNDSKTNLKVHPVLWNAHDIRRLVKRGELPREVDIQQEIEYKANNLHKIKPFLKINRTGRLERDAFMLWVDQTDLYDKFDISYPGMHLKPEEYLKLDKSSPLWKRWGHLYSKENLYSLNSKVPFDIDSTDSTNHGEPGFGLNQFNADLPYQPQIYKDTFISVVMCAFPYIEDACHIHSSTFNPMWCGHPVIQFGPWQHLKYLKERGFKTFSKFWDESYDDIKDPDKRLKAIMRLVEKLSKKPKPELLEMYMDMAPILEYNIGVLRNYNEMHKIKAKIVGKSLM